VTVVSSNVQQTPAVAELLMSGAYASADGVIVADGHPTHDVTYASLINSDSESLYADIPRVALAFGALGKLDHNVALPPPGYVSACPEPGDLRPTLSVIRLWQGLTWEGFDEKGLWDGISMKAHT
jgi:hypothetical protein